MCLKNTPPSTIQQAVNAAQDGDHLIIEPGIYRESIDVIGKNLVMQNSKRGLLTDLIAAAVVVLGIQGILAIPVGGILIIYHAIRRTGKLKVWLLGILVVVALPVLLFAISELMPDIEPVIITGDLRSEQALLFLKGPFRISDQDIWDSIVSGGYPDRARIAEMEQWDQLIAEKAEELSRIEVDPDRLHEVPDTELLDWYISLPDHIFIEQPGWTRAKHDSVYFMIEGAGESRTRMSNSSIDINYDNLHIQETLSGAAYKNLGFAMREDNNEDELIIYMSPDKPLGGPISGLIEALVNGRSYGQVEKGDYVFIDATSWQVYINGELRTPRE